MAATGIEAVYIALGERIAELRRERTLTQEKLAALAEISANYLARVEGGQHRASLPRLEQIAKALDVGLGALFGASSEAAPAMILPGLQHALSRITREDQRLLLKVVERFPVAKPPKQTKRQARR